MLIGFLNISRAVIKVSGPLPLSMRIFVFEIYNKFLGKIGGKGKVRIGTTRFGAKMTCDVGDIIQRYIFYFGVWEPAISKLTAKLLLAGDVYIDVGANIGYDSLLASYSVGRAGGVVSIEASPKIFALLNSNIQINNVHNIRVVNAAASNCFGEIVLYSGNSGNIGQTTTIESRGFAEECKVKAIPLIEIALESELLRTKLIKIDIEGGELSVLDNIITFIDRFPSDLNIIVEASMNEDERGWREIYARYKAAGFDIYEIENRYDLSWYLQDNKKYSLKRVSELPNNQVDLLLTRRKLSDIDMIY